MNCSSSRVCMGNMTCGVALSDRGLHKLQLGIFRSKRCELIRDLRWQGRFLPEHVRQQLSPPELQVQLHCSTLYDIPGFCSRSQCAHMSQ